MTPAQLSRIRECMLAHLPLSPSGGGGRVGVRVMGADTLTVDDLVAALDERGEKWDLHRGVGDGHGPIWVVTLGDRFGAQDDARRFHNLTLEAALRAAVDDGPPLPTVPRRPADIHAYLMTVVRDGSKWAIHYDGRPAGYGNIPTKKAALAAVDKWLAREAEIRATWDAEWGEQVRTGVEGETFRWAP